MKLQTETESKKILAGPLQLFPLLPNFLFPAFIRPVIMADKDINKVNDEGKTRLHVAAEKGDKKACLDLLKDERFTAVDAVDKNKRTALHFCGDSW